MFRRVLFRKVCVFQRVHSIPLLKNVCVAFLHKILDHINVVRSACIVERCSTVYVFLVCVCSVFFNHQLDNFHIVLTSCVETRHFVLTVHYVWICAMFQKSLNEFIVSSLTSGGQWGVEMVASREIRTIAVAKQKVDKLPFASSDGIAHGQRFVQNFADVVTDINKRFDEFCISIFCGHVDGVKLFRMHPVVRNSIPQCKFHAMKFKESVHFGGDLGHCE